MKLWRILSCVLYLACIQANAQSYKVIYRQGKNQLGDEKGNPVNIPGDTAYTDVHVPYGRYIITVNANVQRIYDNKFKLLASDKVIYMPFPDIALIKDSRDSIRVMNTLTGELLLQNINHTYYFNDPRNHKQVGMVLNKFDKGSTVITVDGKLLFALGKCGDISSFTGEYFIVYKDKENVYGIADMQGNMVRGWAPGRLVHIAGPSYSIETPKGYEIFDLRTGAITNYKLEPIMGTGVIATSAQAGNGAKYYGYVNPYNGRVRAPRYIAQQELFNNYINNVPHTLLSLARPNPEKDRYPVLYDIYNVEQDSIIATSTEKFYGKLEKLLFHVRNTDGKYALFNYYGRQITPYDYAAMRVADRGWYMGVQFPADRRWGIIDSSGTLLTKRTYSEIRYILNDYFIYAINGKYGVDKPDGTKMLDGIYDKVYENGKDENGLYYFMAELDDKIAIFNSRNEQLTPFEMTNPDRITDSVFKATVNGKLALYKYNGQCIIPSLDDIGKMSGRDLLWIKRGKHFGLVNTRGKLLVDCIYDRLGQDQEGMYDPGGVDYISLYKDGKTGIVSETGELGIPVVYSKTKVYNINDMAYTVVWQNGKAGLYLNFKKKLADCIYDEILVKDTDTYGPVQVKLKGRYGMVDTGGRVIVPAIYNRIQKLGYSEDYQVLLVTQNREQGLLSADGEVLLPAEYDELQHTEDYEGCAVYTRKGGSWGMCDCTGKQIVPCEFSERIFEDGGVIFKDKMGKQWKVGFNFTVTQP